MRKFKTLNSIIMLRKSKYCFLSFIVPNEYIGVVASLTWSNQSPVVWNSNTSNLIIMTSQKELIMRICQVAYNYRGSCNYYIILLIWMKKYAFVDETRVSNCMIKLNYWLSRTFHFLKLSFKFLNEQKSIWKQKARIRNDKKNVGSTSFNSCLFSNKTFRQGLRKDADIYNLTS